MDNSSLVTFPAVKMQAVSLPGLRLQTRTTAFIDMVLGQKLPIATLHVGAGIKLCKGSNPTIANCCIADNTGAEIGLS